jgi:hypothetical protein
MRAVRIYATHLVTGKPLVWDKTSHSYPVPIVPADHGFLPDAVPSVRSVTPVPAQAAPSLAPGSSRPVQVRLQGSFEKS